jgi:indole-3-glycerol phosphate synthase
VQASADPWIAPAGVLGEILRTLDLRIDALRRDASLERRASEAPAPLSFAEALRAGPLVTVIAEVKRQSPSRGALNTGMNAAHRAREYAFGGATAISVLTETSRFGGSNADLQQVVASVPVCTMRKDFLVHPLQLLETRAIGASAALLIVRALPSSLLREMIATAHALELETLVEVRDEQELERALAAGARIVGVNNRNLETLALDPTTVQRLLPLIPPEVVHVAESGIRDAADVQRAAEHGAHAVLVGSALSMAVDARAAVTALSGVPRRPA